MIKRLSISIVFIFYCISAFSQIPSYQVRSKGNVTPVDSNLYVPNSLRIPVFSDTAQANNRRPLIDSCGRLIFTYDSNKVWYRQCNPKKWVIMGSGTSGGGSQTLQEVFDTEPGGSQLTKGDTIITNAASENGLHLKVTRPASAPWNAMTFTPYGFNVYGNDYHYTKIQDGQVIQKGNWPFTAYLDTTNKIVMSIGYDYDWDHAYLDRADGIDMLFEDNSYYQMALLSRHSRRNPSLAGGLFMAPLTTDFLHVGTEAAYSGDKVLVNGNVRVLDTLKAAGKLKLSGLPTAKKSKQLYFDPATNMVSVGDTSSGSGVDTAVVREIISDSMTYVKNATTGVGQLLYKQGDTIKAKVIVPGYGFNYDSTTTTVFWDIDTLEISTKANMINVVGDTAAALRAAIASGGGGSGNDTLWTARRNANHYGLDSLSRLSAFRATSGGGGGTTYATWGADRAAGMTVSGGGLVIAGSAPGTNHQAARATIGKSGGKWYWEITGTSVGSGVVGVATSSAGLTTILGGDSGGWGYKDDGEGIHSGSNVFFGTSFTTGDKVSCKLDMDAGTFEVLKNNVSVNTFTGLTGTIYPAVSSGVFSSSTFTANFGATAFTYSVPSGYNSGIYTSGGTTYANVFSTDTSGHVFIGAETGNSGLNINRAVSFTKDSIQTTAAIDSALTVANDGKLNIGPVKNIGNSDFTQTVSQRNYLFGYSGSKFLNFGKSDKSERVNFYIGNNASSGLGAWYAYSKHDASNIEIEYYANPGNKYNYILVNNSAASKANYTKNYLDSTIFNFYQSGKTYGFGRDSMYIKGIMPVSSSSSDSVLVRDGNGIIKTRAQSDFGLLTELSNAPDADWTATVGTMRKIANGSLTANRTVTMPSGTAGQRIVIWNREAVYTVNLSGVSTVYWDESSITSIPANTRISFTYQDSKWVVEN